jgi:GNAT superfamily N-acetyltransferase/RimJ/RimL family protein N-acetyltransferase
MEIAALDLTDDGTVSACHTVREDAMRADDPFASPISARLFRSSLSSGWSGGPFEVWYVPGGDGAVAGWYRAEFPDLENLDRTLIQLIVHPARRRGGLGAALLGHAAERAAASGREILHSEVKEGSPGEVFALRFGATLGIAEVRRVQELAQIPAGTVTRLRATTAGAASGYSLVRWTGVTPEERIDQVAALHDALNDSPRDAAVEPTAWTPERVRGRMNARIARSPLRRYSLAAVHNGTGEMAALTVVAVDPDVPDWGQQLITAVTRPHRGHRLGLLVKTAMLGWLAETEPRLEHIETWNAGANQHMIAINESLGYTARGQFRSAELRVAALSGTEVRGASD